MGLEHSHGTQVGLVPGLAHIVIPWQAMNYTLAA